MKIKDYYYDYMCILKLENSHKISNIFNLLLQKIKDMTDSDISEAETRELLPFLFTSLLKWLIDCQSSCQLISCQ